MRIKSLLVTLGILGSSSLALADHGRRYDRDDDRPRVREVYRPRTTWTPLTAQQRLDRGRDVFDIDRRQRFAQLRLQNQTGRTFVRHIEIIFANGARQHVHVDRMLDGNHAMVNVDLDGRARRIDHVIVHGRSGRAGSHQLYAM
jgi:hypothetical protein